jgi:lipooligosaccharide transport system permease protein
MTLAGIQPAEPTVPAGPVGSPGPIIGDALPRPSARRAVAAAYEHQLLLYRRTWRGSVFGNFAQPILFLLAMGVGLGGYVDRAGTAALGGVSYLEFLAPALLVTTTMQGAAFEGTFSVLAGFRWTRRYHAMYATPLTPFAIAFGQIAWVATRATLVASTFALVSLVLGAAATWGILLAIPVGTLTGLAFAGPIGAFMSTQRDTSAFNNIWRFGILPLFLFSGTFFPIQRLPEGLQLIAWVLPTWNGVALARSLTLGTIAVDPVAQLAHLLILVTEAVVGVSALFVMFRRQLER